MSHLDRSQYDPLACLLPPHMLSSASENASPAASHLDADDPVFSDAQLEATLALQYAQLMPMLQSQMPTSTPATTQSANPFTSTTTASSNQPPTKAGIGGGDVEAIQAAIYQASMLQTLQNGINQQAIQLLLSNNVAPDTTGLLLGLLGTSAAQQVPKQNTRSNPLSDKPKPSAPAQHLSQQRGSKQASISSDPLSDSDGAVGAREKNRLAQRRFRERQRNLINSLKDQADSAEAKYQAAEKEITALKAENEQLKARLQQMHTSTLASYTHRSSYSLKHRAHIKEDLEQSCRQDKKPRLDLSSRMQLQNPLLQDDDDADDADLEDEPSSPLSSPGSMYSPGRPAATWPDA